VTDDRDRRHPRPRTPPPDSDQPPSGETSLDDSAELADLTPPPHEIERLLYWTTRKLPNKLAEMSEAIRHVRQTPGDHERRLRALENERLDLKLEALEKLHEDLEGTVNAHIEKTTTTLDDLKGFKNRLGGVAIVGSFFGSIVGAVIIYLITKQL